MAVVATGFFDGVHPGHRLVIETLLSEARARGEQSLVVTFWPHPRAVLQSGADSLRYLTSRAERVEMLKALGVDAVETIPFSREFAALSAEQYLRMLCRDYQCSALVLGYDTRFGVEQAGPEKIAALAAGMGLDAVITPPVCVDGAPVSSTRIRTALEAGDVALATRLLGRPYRLHGVVVPGNRLGRTIGFPTANIKLYEPLMLVPRNGVYKTAVFTANGLREETFLRKALPPVASNGRGPRSGRGSEATSSGGTSPGANRSSYTGMTNIGVRPTVSDQKILTIETYIFDFDEMIYGLDLTVDFISRIRDERKFASLQDLRLQLTADAAQVSSI
jgi:riboflavin kinase/FMN adenylyltransferase